MVKNALITIAVLPLVFFACMFLFASDTHAASTSLKDSVASAKSQKPEIDRSSIAGSIAYAKYQGELIEQEKFEKNEVESEISIDEVDTTNKMLVLGEFTEDFALIDNSTLVGSINLAKTMPKRDQTTLSGSIMTARSYDRISQR